MLAPIHHFSGQARSHQVYAGTGSQASARTLYHPPNPVNGVLAIEEYLHTSIVASDTSDDVAPVATPTSTSIPAPAITGAPNSDAPYPTSSRQIDLSRDAPKHACKVMASADFNLSLLPLQNRALSKSPPHKKTSAMDASLAGFSEERMPLKMLYTCAPKRSGAQRFVAKPRALQRVLTANSDETSSKSLGVVDMGLCLRELLKAAPEVADAAEFGDFTIYSCDQTEEGAPLQPHGRLSALTSSQAEQQWLTGRVCASELCPRMLEVELHLAPRVSPQQQPAQSQRTNSTRFYSESTPAQLVSSPVSFVPPSSPPTLTSARKHESVAAGTLKLSLSDLEEATLSGSESNDQSNDGHRKRSPGEPSSAVHCQNCGIMDTINWRKVFPENEPPMILCNACGLWFKNKREMRPQRKWMRQQKAKPERWQPNVPVSETDTEAESDPRHKLRTSPVEEEVTDGSTPVDSPLPQPQKTIPNTRGLPAKRPFLALDADSVAEKENRRWANAKANGLSSSPVASTHITSLPCIPQIPQYQAARSATIADPVAYSDINLPQTPRAGRSHTVQYTPGINDIADLLFTPKRRVDANAESVGSNSGSLAPNSASTRRWLSRFMNFTGVEDDLAAAEMYLHKENEGLAPALDFELRVHDLHVDMASSSIPSSPPSSSMCYDVPASDHDRVLPSSPSPMKRRRLEAVYASD